MRAVQYRTFFFLNLQEIKDSLLMVSPLSSPWKLSGESSRSVWAAQMAAHAALSLPLSLLYLFFFFFFPFASSGTSPHRNLWHRNPHHPHWKKADELRETDMDRKVLPLSFSNVLHYYWTDLFTILPCVRAFPVICACQGKAQRVRAGTKKL